MRQLAQTGIKGGTILDGTGMAKSLVSMEDLPIFAILKHILADEENERCKVMMFLLKEEQVITTRGTIRNVIGDLNLPNTGIMFGIPITYVEGLGE